VCAPEQQVMSFERFVEEIPEGTPSREYFNMPHNVVVASQCKSQVKDHLKKVKTKVRREVYIVLLSSIAASDRNREFLKGLAHLVE